MPRGGFRPGSGTKAAGYVPPQEKVDFDRERAAHEKVKREQRELNLAIKRREYLPREAQRQAAAAAVAMFSQAMRAIPDNLERTCNLTPEQAEQAAIAIDSALSDLAAGLRALVLDD